MSCANCGRSGKWRTRERECGHCGYRVVETRERQPVKLLACAKCGFTFALELGAEPPCKDGRLGKDCAAKGVGA